MGTLFGMLLIKLQWRLNCDYISAAVVAWHLTVAKQRRNSRDVDRCACVLGFKHRRGRLMFFLLVSNINDFFFFNFIFSIYTSSGYLLVVHSQRTHSHWLLNSVYQFMPESKHAIITATQPNCQNKFNREQIDSDNQA